METRHADLETRERLLMAAARLFAERGFDAVTVRDISAAAEANVAAVNYHYGDKLGLYREVLGRAVDRIRATTDLARQTAEGLAPADRLRVHIRVFLARTMAAPGEGWVSRLISREMHEPTAAFDDLMNLAIRPRLHYLAAIVAELMGCEPNDPRVLRSVASIHAQCVMHVPGSVAGKLRPEGVGASSADELADHIATFSLAGINAIRAQAPEHAGQGPPPGKGRRRSR